MSETEWKSLAAISDVAIYLKPIVDSIQSDPDSWQSWFTNPRPETLQLPCDCEEQQDQSLQDGDPSPPHSPPASEDLVPDRTEKPTLDQKCVPTEPSGPIKRLLTVKCLRPDRFLEAFQVVSSSAMRDYHEKKVYSFEDLFLQSGTPTIILLPSSFSVDSSTTFSDQSMSNCVAKVLKDKAEVKR